MIINWSKCSAGLLAKRPASTNNSNAYFLSFIIIPFLLVAISTARKYLKPQDP